MAILVGALLLWLAAAVYVWLDMRAHRRLLKHFERLDREHEP